MLISEIDPGRREYIEACIADTRLAYKDPHAATYLGAEGITALSAVCDTLFIPEVEDGLVHLSDDCVSEGTPVVALWPGEQVLLPADTTRPSKQQLERAGSMLDQTSLWRRTGQIIQDAVQLFEGCGPIRMSGEATAYVASELQPLETGDATSPKVLYLQGRSCLVLRYGDQSQSLTSLPTMGHELTHLLQNARGIQIAPGPGEEGLYQNLVGREIEAYHVGGAIARGLADSGEHTLTLQNENQIEIDTILTEDALNNPNAVLPTPNALLKLKIGGLLPPNFRY